MHYNVCLMCGAGRCRCAWNRDWRAPMVTMRDAIRREVPPNGLVVFGTSEHASFDPVWGGDPDWDLSLEPI